MTSPIKRAIIHVGPHKTGSSYLQACFSHYRAALRARGIVVPAAWEFAPGNPSHTGLASALREGGDLSQAERVLREEFVQGGDTLLVSAEDISSMKAEPLQRLRHLLGDTQVTIVFYVRRWSDLLPSGWQETIKQGQSTSFAEFLAGHVRNPRASQIFNLDMKLKHLMEVFGQGSIGLVCYSGLVDMNIDLFTQFAADFLNWGDAAPLPGSLQVNKSRGIKEIELIRRLNMIAFQRTGERSAGLRNRLDRCGARIDLSFVLAAMEPARDAILFDDGFPFLRQMHLELYTQFAENIRGPAPRKMLFQPHRRDLPYINDTYLMRPGVVKEFHDLYDQILPE
jgi:hypothetical protein